jgi:hypothetical protein
MRLNGPRARIDGTVHGHLNLNLISAVWMNR